MGSRYILFFVITKKIRTILKLTAIGYFLLLGINIFPAVSQTSKDIFVEHRARLCQQIDSLDIEKQLKKRAGESITEIEERQKVLVDSLKILRSTFQNDMSYLKTQPNPDNGLFPSSIAGPLQPIINSVTSLLNPKSTFDWFILITSGIAFISIFILFIAIVSVIKRRLRAKKTVSRPHVSTPPKSVINRTSENPQLENQSITLLNDLKKRVQVTNVDPGLPDIRFTPPEYHATATKSTPSTSDNLESQVLEAYQNGLEISEISKKFHISSDHVSLIIKVKNS
jgi:hypothetical protein